MKNPFPLCLALLALILQPVAVLAQPVIHHDLKVRLLPDQHHLQVEDTLRLPKELLQAGVKDLVLVLHEGLNAVSLTPDAKITKLEAVAPEIAFHSQDEIFSEAVSVEYYRVTLPPNTDTLSLKYQGEIYHPLKPQSEEYARSFSETAGIISPEGVYLDHSSVWYPRFKDERLTFSLTVELSEGWDAVSQGDRTLHGTKEGITQVRWGSPEPQEKIFLIAGKFTEYTGMSDQVKILCFLRSPDKDLAERYIKATARYLQMYRKLIGPYPYKKFALVENFWETGYGMPSFTLLGSKVIRLPFMIHSSYPHEILHNWWGNGVYVSDEGGNWSEGLTTYLADYLIQEQKGTAAESRRATLQKYSDYVDQAEDFPLTEFRYRHSSVTEAVGYGKTLMFFHMLRQRLGDKGFIRALQKFYRDYRFKHAGFGDLKTAFSKAAGQDLEAEFSQWIDRAGAPILQVSRTRASRQGKGFHLTSVIEQIQSGPFYRLRIPMAVHLEGKEQAYQTTVLMDSQRLELSLQVPERPVRLEIDPEFDLFRRLDKSEVPPALSQAFGSSNVWVVLPYKADKEILEGYRRLAESWKRSRLGELEIILDSEVDRLPLDRAIWLFGWENKFIPDLKDAVKGYPVSFSESSLEVGGTKLARDKHSAVLTARHPANPDLALAWLAADRVLAIPGLGQKLPHYGKYSYLGFQGDDPVNILKGEWPVGDSSLSVAVAQGDGYQVSAQKAKLAPRPALVSLP